MAQIHFEKLDLNGAFLIENTMMQDNRGSFTKYYEQGVFRENGIDFHVSESFVTVSDKNVIRGLHFQDNEPQAKLVTVLKGRVWDVIVDLRRDSVTFGEWRGYELSGSNGKSIYIPKGFAHGFVSMESQSIMLYQCQGTYLREFDTGIIYNDERLNIKWPVEESNIICSKRDMELQTLNDYLNK